MDPDTILHHVDQRYFIKKDSIGHPTQYLGRAGIGKLKNVEARSSLKHRVSYLVTTIQNLIPRHCSMPMTTTTTNNKLVSYAGFLSLVALISAVKSLCLLPIVPPPVLATLRLSCMFMLLEHSHSFQTLL